MNSFFWIVLLMFKKNNIFQISLISISQLSQSHFSPLTSQFLNHTFYTLLTSLDREEYFLLFKNKHQSIQTHTHDLQKIRPKNLLIFSALGFESIHRVTNFIPPLSRGGRGCVHQRDGLYTRGKHEQKFSSILCKS